MHAEQAYLFRHAVLRDAAYQLELPGARATLHALALETIEATVPEALHDAMAAELAEHARLAEPPRPQRELHYLWRAGVYASRQYQPAQSAQYLERAARHPAADVLTRTTRMLEAARMWINAENMAQSAVCARDADELARGLPDVMLQARARKSVIAALEFAGRRTEAQTQIGELLALARRHGLKLVECSALNSLAEICKETGRLPEAEQHFRAALAVVLSLGDRGREAGLMNNLGLLLTRLARHDEAEQVFRQALTLNEAATGRLSNIILGNLGSLYMERKQYAEAEALFEQSLSLHRARHYRRGEVIQMTNLAVVALLAGRVTQARQRMAQVRELLREHVDVSVANEMEENWAKACGQTGHDPA